LPWPSILHVRRVNRDQDVRPLTSSCPVQHGRF
jgi:hypothetical protein